VATAGLKVAVFSASCRGFVRVARKGLSEGKLTVDSLKLKEETSGELNAEAPGAQREEKPDERRGDWVVCDENMGHDSTGMDYCQDIVL